MYIKLKKKNKTLPVLLFPFVSVKKYICICIEKIERYTQRSEKAMAPHSSTLAWQIHGRRSLVGSSPWVAKSWTWLSDFPFTFHFHALEKEMATHPSVLAWRIPGTAEPGGLPSLGLHRVGHDRSDLAAAAAAVAYTKIWDYNSFKFFSYLLEPAEICATIILPLEWVRFWKKWRKGRTP